MDHPPCPHCGVDLKRFELPDNTGWTAQNQLACFNDECPYYVRGWKHMEEHYAVRASYRFRVDPATGASSPLAVWSPTAVRDRILDDDTDDPEDSATPNETRDGSDQGST